MPSSARDKVTEQLLASLYAKYEYDDLLISREGSNFVFQSVEESIIHFHKIDLRRGSSYIESPEWLKHKKATINPQNKNNIYCFMYEIAISLSHEALGKNHGCVSKKLMEYANLFIWHEIEFTASYDD